MSVVDTDTTAESTKQTFDVEFDAADSGSRDSPDEMTGERCAYSCLDSTSC